MAKELSAVDTVSAMTANQYLLIDAGGSIKRIKLGDFQNSLNTGDETMLAQIAWGVVIGQNATSQNWQRVGSTALWQAYKLQIGRYLLTNGGVAAKLQSNDSAYYADGTVLNETKGHVMVYIPRLYYRVVTSDGVATLWMSQNPIGGHYIEDSWVGAYKGYLNGNALVSRSGFSPTGSNTINQFWTAAQVNGAKFGLINYDHRRLLMMLQLSEYANPNVQTTIGYGLCGQSGNQNGWNNTSNLLTGATKSLGDSTGKIDVSVEGGTNCSRVNFFGIEDLWGWQWEMTQGVYFGSEDNNAQDGNEVFIYHGNRMPDGEELAGGPLGDFRVLPGGRIPSNGFIKTMILGEYFDLFARAIGGGDTSYWGDQVFNYSTSSGSTDVKLTGQLLHWGGSAHSGSSCGLGYSRSSNGWSCSDSTFGSRLAFYGLPTIVGGKLI